MNNGTVAVEQEQGDNLEDQCGNLQQEVGQMVGGIHPGWATLQQDSNDG